MASSPVQMQDLGEDGDGRTSGAETDPPVADTGVESPDSADEATAGTGEATDAIGTGGGRGTGDHISNTSAELLLDLPGKPEPAKPDPEASVPEKLADDVMRPPLWRRVLYRVIPALEKSECSSISLILAVYSVGSVVETRRVFRANDVVYNVQYKYSVSRGGGLEVAMAWSRGHSQASQSLGHTLNK